MYIIKHLYFFLFALLYNEKRNLNKSMYSWKLQLALYMFVVSIFSPAMNKDQWDPEFLKAIPIMKTRSGMQFSCASPSHSCPENTYEVWVCNSDGYVGQVCLLNIRDEPTVEACIAVCSARIICIAAVPGLKNRWERLSPDLASHNAPVCETELRKILRLNTGNSSLTVMMSTLGLSCNVWHAVTVALQ